MSAKIFFNSFCFNAGGARPWYSRKAQYQADSPGGIPQRAMVEYSVKTWFLEPSFADNQTRYRTMLAAIEGAMEGNLRIIDENGTQILSVNARPAAHELPEQWGEHLAEVTVTFHGVEDLTTEASTAAVVFTPTGSMTGVTLSNVTHFAENIRTTRPALNVPNRRETEGVVAASGRIMADPSLTPAQRRSYLLGQKAAIQAAADAADGTLVFGSFSQRVRVTELNANLEDATDQLLWTLQANYQRFPSGSYAEAEFNLIQRDNLQASERITTVRGKVRSDSEADALTKVAALQTAYTTSGQMLISDETSEARMSGTDGDTFIELDFSFELRQTLAVTSYKLSVSTRADTRSGQTLISYNGTVTATSSSAALTQARSLGNAKYPVQMSAVETVDTISAAGGGPQFTQVTFSYEYTTKGGALYAEVSSETDNQTFGVGSQVVSGYATADTQADALTLARSFQLSGLLLRSAKETPEILEKDSTTLFVKVTFAYAYIFSAAAGSIEYGVDVNENLKTRERIVTYNGTAYGPDESTADALITATAVDSSGTKLTNKRESKWDTSGETTVFLSRNFSISFSEPLSAGGYDILEAEYTVENIYSVNKAVLTYIPGSTADVQDGQGTTIGYRRVSGKITCLTTATAKTFARALQPSGGYLEEGANKERFGTKFLPFSGTTVQSVSLDFEYAMAYTNLVAS